VQHAGAVDAVDDDDGAFGALDNGATESQSGVSTVKHPRRLRALRLGAQEDAVAATI
jgi:hypothetical protein